jgi:hypothetical protein
VPTPRQEHHTHTRTWQSDRPGTHSQSGTDSHKRQSHRTAWRCSAAGGGGNVRVPGSLGICTSTISPKGMNAACSVPSTTSSFNPPARATHSGKQFTTIHQGRATRQQQAQRAQRTQCEAQKTTMDRSTHVTTTLQPRGATPAPLQGHPQARAPCMLRIADVTGAAKQGCPAVAAASRKCSRHLHWIPRSRTGRGMRKAAYAKNCGSGSATCPHTPPPLPSPMGHIHPPAMQVHMAGPHSVTKGACRTRTGHGAGQERAFGAHVRVRASAPFLCSRQTPTMLSAPTLATIIQRSNGGAGARGTQGWTTYQRKPSALCGCAPRPTERDTNAGVTKRASAKTTHGCPRIHNSVVTGQRHTMRKRPSRTRSHPRAGWALRSSAPKEAKVDGRQTPPLPLPRHTPHLPYKQPQTHSRQGVLSLEASAPAHSPRTTTNTTGRQAAVAQHHCCGEHLRSAC